MTNPRRVSALLVLTMVGITACAVKEDDSPISALEAFEHNKVFASNDVPGDDPGSPEQQRALEYAKSYLESLGLKTTMISVPLVNTIPVSSVIQVHRPSGAIINEDTSNEHFIVWPGRQETHVSLDASVVFAGYGIVSPEYARDDFKAVDVRGKIVVVLGGSPPISGRDDLGVLGHTYYGTAEYKFAEAAQKGAAGVLIIPGDFGAPWENRKAVSKRSHLDLDWSSRSAERLPKAQIEGWLSRTEAETLLAVADLTYAELLAKAAELAFQPIDIPNAMVSIELTTEVVRYTAYDVIAEMPGATPEYVLIAGRWNTIDPDAWPDTLAPLPTTPGNVAPVFPPDTDRLARVRSDDGSGAAVVLEAARILATEHPRPTRTIVFMVTTALRPGLLGLEHFVEAPPESLAVEILTALVFLDHADMENVGVRVGKIGTSADEALSQIVRESAVEQGRLFELDDHAPTRFFYALGKAALGRLGVRTIYLTSPMDEDNTGRTIRNLARRDEVVGLVGQKQHRQSAGPINDVGLLVAVANRVANATNWPPRLEPAVSVR